MLHGAATTLPIIRARCILPISRRTQNFHSICHVETLVCPNNTASNPLPRKRVVNEHSLPRPPDNAAPFMIQTNHIGLKHLTLFTL